MFQIFFLVCSLICCCSGTAYFTTLMYSDAACTTLIGQGTQVIGSCFGITPTACTADGRGYITTQCTTNLPTNSLPSIFLFTDAGCTVPASTAEYSSSGDTACLYNTNSAASWTLSCLRGTVTFQNYQGAFCSGVALNYQISESGKVILSNTGFVGL